MELFVITFIIMLIVIVIMAIGYIFQKKKIKGSCGGIAELGLEKVCDCEEPCEKRKAMLKRLEQQKIDIKTIEEKQK